MRVTLRMFFDAPPRFLDGPPEPLPRWWADLYALLYRSEASRATMHVEGWPDAVLDLDHRGIGAMAQLTSNRRTIP